MKMVQGDAADILIPPEAPKGYPEQDRHGIKHATRNEEPHGCVNLAQKEPPAMPSRDGGGLRAVGASAHSVDFEPFPEAPQLECGLDSFCVAYALSVNRLHFAGTP
jgi:hypothetical protein